MEKRGVKIVSGGNPVDQEERLKALLKESGIETTIRVQVGSKEELKGKRVEHLIDDTPPTIQGFDAIRWFKPDEIVNE